MPKQIIFKPGEKVCLKKNYKNIGQQNRIIKANLTLGTVYTIAHIYFNAFVYVIKLEGTKYWHDPNQFKRAPVLPVQLKVGDTVRLKSNWRKIAEQTMPSYLILELRIRLKQSKLLSDVLPCKDNNISIYSPCYYKRLTGKVTDVATRTNRIFVGSTYLVFSRELFQKVCLKSTKRLGTTAAFGEDFIQK